LFKKQEINFGGSKMNIIVAGNKKEYTEGLTIAELVVIENVETPQYVTVSLNDEFVESGAFETTVLHDGDNVEFLYFMGGGK
jgi:sulfur carrier protein